jgi:hypothetical protein
MIPAIKAVRSIDQLRDSRAMDKPFRAQARRRIRPPRNGTRPLTPLHDMAGACTCTLARISSLLTHTSNRPRFSRVILERKLL